MLLSKACEYGIRAVLHLSESAPGTYVPIRSISEALGIPYHFLAKVVQTLAQADVIVSTRGPHGGIALARPPGKIMLKEIVVPIDGGRIFTECVLGLPGCGEGKPCPLHDQWAPARARINRMFAQTSVGDMAERMRTEDLRLSSLLAEVA